MEFKVDWRKLKNFETRNSKYKGSWITKFYNDGCKRKGIKCWQDFYEVIGVDFEKINPRDLHNPNKVRRLRPHEIIANPKTNAKICDFISNQFHPTKYKGRRPSAIGFDSLQYCPCDDGTIAEDLIVIRIDSTIKWDKELDYYEQKD